MDERKPADIDDKSSDAREIDEKSEEARRELDEIPEPGTDPLHEGP